VTVAAGDVNGDGRAEVVVAAGAGGGPGVAIFALQGGGATLLRSFFAFDPSFTGGVHLAVGDVSGDGFADVVCGAGGGGGPNVAGSTQSLGSCTATRFCEPRLNGSPGQIRVAFPAAGG